MLLDKTRYDGQSVSEDYLGAKQFRVWPHNYQELEKIISSILGNGNGELGEILNIARLYTVNLLNEKAGSPKIMTWPENFLTDLLAFYYAANPILYAANQARLTPMGYCGIARSYVKDGNKSIIKIIRMDGASLEIEMTEKNIDSLMQALSLAKQFKFDTGKLF